MKHLKPFTVFIFIYLFSTNLHGQNNEKAAAFFSESLTYKWNKNWSINFEAQQRFMEDFPTLDYYELKGGVGYKLNSQHQPYLGLGRFVTYKEGDVNREEFRIWAQYTFTHKINRLKIDHRGRFEQRFFHNPQTDENSTANRYRYRLNANLPLNKPSIEAKTIYANAYDEVFFSDESKPFARNRFFVGGGYKFSDLFNLGVGYLHQRDYSDTGDKIYHFTYLSLAFTIDNQTEN